MQKFRISNLNKYNIIHLKKQKLHSLIYEMENYVCFMERHGFSGPFVFQDHLYFRTISGLYIPTSEKSKMAFFVIAGI